MKSFTLTSLSGSKLNKHLLTLSSEETFAFGLEIGKHVLPNAVLCLFGDLAAGKTTLIKGIVEGFTGISSEEVTSPTFTYLNIYQGASKRTVYHFDLYRLHDPDEFLSLGFEEFFTAGGICCIEWSERIAPLIPPQAITLHLTHEGLDRRKISYDKIYL